MKNKQTFDKHWRFKTIEVLENRYYGDPSDPNNAPTGLVKRCLKLTKVPVNEFTVDDIRLMIGQQFALRYLIPLALEYLHIDVFTESIYPGDLLQSVLRADAGFWQQNKVLWKEVFDLIKDKRGDLANQKIDTSIFDAVDG